MKKLLKPLKSKAMLRIAMFATLFVLLDTFIEMNKKTEEQVTYSITLENLAHGQNGETDGETGGGGADGEVGGGGTDGENGGTTTGTDGDTTGGTNTGGGTTTGSGSDTTFAYQEGKLVDNVSCIKQFGFPILIKLGHRDKCKDNGPGCRPTRCL